MIPCASPLPTLAVTVRRATHDDVAALVPLLCLGAHEYPSARAPFPDDPRHAERTLHGMLEYGLVLVAERMGAIVGVIAGAVQRHPYDLALIVLAHHFVVVDPSYRRDGIGAALLAAFDAEGAAEGAHWVTVSLAANTPSAVDAALVRMGYRESDRTYLREVAR